MPFIQRVRSLWRPISRGSACASPSFSSGAITSTGNAPTYQSASRSAGAPSATTLTPVTCPSRQWIACT